MADYKDINSLEEITFIAGTEYIIYFKVYNQDGTPANLTSSTCTWKMCPYGEPTNVVLEYTGTVTATDTFSVTLLPADTLSLSGKFIHQPIVETSGVTRRSQQGIITIIPAII